MPWLVNFFQNLIVVSHFIAMIFCVNSKVSSDCRYCHVLHVFNIETVFSRCPQMAVVLMPAVFAAWIIQFSICDTTERTARLYIFINGIFNGHQCGTICIRVVGPFYCTSEIFFN